jgi:hypothetical protein
MFNYFFKVIQSASFLPGIGNSAAIAGRAAASSSGAAEAE